MANKYFRAKSATQTSFILVYVGTAIIGIQCGTLFADEKKAREKPPALFTPAYDLLTSAFVDPHAGEAASSPEINDIRKNGREAVALYHNGDYVRGLTHAKVLKTKCENANLHDVRRIAAEVLLGEFHFARGDYNSAKEQFALANEYADEWSIDKVAQIQIVARLAQMLNYSAEYEEALSVADNARVSVLKSSPDWNHAVAEVYVESAVAAGKLGRIKTAKRFIEDAKVALSNSDRQMARIAAVEADLAMTELDTDTASIRINEAEELLKKGGNQQTVDFAEVLAKHSMILCDIRDFRSAQEVAASAVERATHLLSDQHPISASCGRCLATTYHRAGDTVAANQILSSPFRVHSSKLRSDHEELVEDYVLLGDFVLLSRPDLASEAFDKAVDLLRQSNNVFRVAAIQDRRARLAARKHDFPAAHRASAEALAIAESHFGAASKLYIEYCFTEITILDIEQRETEALQLTDKLLTNFNQQSIRDPQYAFALILKARFLEKRNELETATAVLKDAAAVLAIFDNPKYAPDPAYEAACTSLATILCQQQSYEDSVEWFKRRVDQRSRRIPFDAEILGLAFFDLGLAEAKTNQLVRSHESLSRSVEIFSALPNCETSRKKAQQFRAEVAARLKSTPLQSGEQTLNP